LRARRPVGVPNRCAFQINDKLVTHAVLVPPVSSEDGAGYLELPRSTIHVAFVDKPLFALSIEEPATGFVIDRARSLELQMRCKIERCAQCAPVDALKFDVEGLPPGMRLTSQVLSANADSGTLTLVADDKKVEAGYHRIALRARARINGREISETTSAITVRVK
jgi:hypothetical protein